MIAFWMKRTLAGLLMTALFVDPGLAQHHPDDFRRSMGNLRPSHRTAVPATQGSPPPYTDFRRRSGHSYVYRPHYPVYDYGYNRYPYGWSYSGYPSYVPSYWRYGYSTPLVFPQVAPVVVGVNQLVVPQQVVGANQPAARQPVQGANQPAVPKPAVVRRAVDKKRNAEPVRDIANRSGNAKAQRYIGYGDAHFRNGKYSEANRRYRSAAKADVELADAYFRQGYALMAMGRYEPATHAIKQGLMFAPDWDQSGFHNDDLYGPNLEAKTEHLDALATAAADAPDDPVLQFLFGVCLYFDGQPDQATPFFEHAARLSGNGAHLIGFLRDASEGPPKPAPAPQE